MARQSNLLSSLTHGFCATTAPPRVAHPASKASLTLIPWVGGAVGLVGLVSLLVASWFQLQQVREDGALHHADALAQSFAKQLRSTAPDEHTAMLKHLAAAAATRALLLTHHGHTLYATDTLDAATQLRLLQRGRGIHTTPTGNFAFATYSMEPPYGNLAVMVLEDTHRVPLAMGAFLLRVALPSGLLVGIALFFTWRHVHQQRRSFGLLREQMLHAAQQPPPEHPPLGSTSANTEAQLLATALNALLLRLTNARKGYELAMVRADVTDRSRARFLEALSHELRTPLNGILGFTDLLLTEVEGPLPSSAREDLDIVRSSGLHLRDLIDDVIDFSIIEAGNLRLEMARTDVYALAEEVRRELAPLLSHGRVQMRVTGAQPAYAEVDPRRLRQILTNLVGNALKFTEKGSVTVALEIEDDTLVIEVRDTGPGIPQPEHAVIFEEYSQAGTLTDRRKGTGLGLAIAKRLTRMHGGSLSLDSRVGHGSTFRVEVPVVAKPPPRPPAPLPT